MSVKEVNTFLKTKKFHASKKMGQNFLTNPQIMKRIVAAANLNPKDIVLEIGPGVGAITGVLLTNKIKLIAIELDKRLAELLSEKFQSYNNFVLHNVDALKVDWNDLLLKYTNQNNVKLVANLPYCISSLLVLKIIKTPLVNEAVIMVQKEMAERICAKTGSRAYNMFTVLVQLFLKVEKLFDVDPSNFSPRPKVQSSVIRLTKLDNDSSHNLDHFKNIDSFLRLAFANKRKKLINNLVVKYNKEQIINVLEQLQFPPTIRAEQIEPNDLVKIMTTLEHDKSL